MFDDSEMPDVWDEYQWERFLQQQDKSTEKYFGLLEQYLDDPERDEIIAREMGWKSFGTEEDDEWVEAAEGLCEGEFLALDSEEIDEEEGEFDQFARSPIYQDTIKLHAWINSWLERDELLKDHPETVRLVTRSAVCGAKLAAALCGDDSTELGMTIAYLKRGLKAANDALDAGLKLVVDGRMTARQHRFLQRQLFKVRNRIVDLMSEYRNEWYRRYGKLN